MSDYIPADGDGAIPSPSVVRWSDALKQPLPMDENNELSCCGPAAFAHMRQVWTANRGNELVLPVPDVIEIYKSQGYVPGDPSTDNGVCLLDMLKWLRSQKMIDGYAHVNIRTHFMGAMQLFGGAMLGLQIQDAQQDQFDAGQPWAMVPGKPIEGGHAVNAINATADGNIDIGTWGKVQPVTQAYFQSQCDECWVLFSGDWVDRAKAAPCSVDYDSLLADLAKVA